MPSKRGSDKGRPIMPSLSESQLDEIDVWLAVISVHFVHGLRAAIARRDIMKDQPSEEGVSYYRHAGRVIEYVFDQLSIERKRHENARRKRKTDR